MKKFALFICVIAGIFFLWGPGSGVWKKPPAGPRAPLLDREPVFPGGHLVEHFTLEGFGEKGGKIWTLEGDLAHISPLREIFIEKNVVLTIEGSTTVEGDKVYWQHDRNRFMTSRPVKVIHEKQIIEGIGGLGRPNDEFLQINQNVGMSLKGPVLITCRGPFKIYRKADRALFYRDVMITDTKGTLTADRLDVYFKEDKIQKIIAEGNVHIERDGNASVSDKAVYNAETQSVKLVGTPKLSITKRDTQLLDKIKNTNSLIPVK